jgi:hypothetical protein
MSTAEQPASTLDVSDLDRPRVQPGHHLVCHRMPYDYKVRDTKFAGPTCFQQGDTLYINQRGERVTLPKV